MKRITAMLISIVFVFSLLCSCGQPQPTPDTSESDSLRAEIARLQKQLASQAKLITQLLEQKEDALQNNNGNENQNEKEMSKANERTR